MVTTETVGVLWLEDKYFSKDGVHFDSLWYGICKKSLKVAWVFFDPSKILMLPNVNLSWDKCDFGELCLNVECPFSESENFGSSLQQSDLCYDESVGGKKKIYFDKWQDKFKETAWLLLKEIQQNGYNIGKLSDTAIGREFFFTKTQYIPSFLSSNKKKKKKTKRRNISGNVRQDVFMRDKYTCQICGATVKDGAKLEIDHIIPVSKGGSNKEDNLQTLCRRCNREKRNRTDLLHDKLKLEELNGSI